MVDDYKSPIKNIKILNETRSESNNCEDRFESILLKIFNVLLSFHEKCHPEI